MAHPVPSRALRRRFCVCFLLCSINVGENVQTKALRPTFMQVISGRIPPFRIPLWGTVRSWPRPHRRPAIRAKDYTPEITKVKLLELHGKMPLKIHWTVLMEIHW